MDSLLSNLSNFEVSSHPNNPNAEHPHYTLYKTKFSASSQDERRKKILDVRKEARYDLLNHLRKLEENIDEDEEAEIEEEESMAVDEPKKLYKKPKEYRNFVMLSEWLVDIPEDFTQNYFAVICPTGKRSLCVCYKGTTSIYAKNGRRIIEFFTALPGGSPKTFKHGYTVLDCIWSESKRTFFIIDLIFWHRQSFIECDTSFRFVWLKSRISELDEDVTVFSKNNKYKFIPVPFYGCDKASLSSLFGDPLLSEVSLDGVLFYHKETHYIHGPSPLVCWLKAFMFPEILDVAVPEKFLQERPAQYTNLSSHISEYEESRKKMMEAKKKSSKKEKMEVCPAKTAQS